MRIPHSHSSPLLKFHQLHCQDTEATQVSGSKGTITGKKMKFQPHCQKKYSRINYNSVANGMLCQYCSHIYKEDREVLKHTQGAWHIYKEDREVLKHTQGAWHIYKEDREVLKHTQGAWHIYKEDREVLKHTQGAWHIYKEDREELKHTQGAWISFPVSNWKALDKMKAHEASAWYKMAKAKLKAEKQSQAEGSVILQLKQGKERCDEQTKQQNRILIKKLLRIM